jgi:hypothetical protein
MSGEDTMTPEGTPGASNRRGALAALLAGSALGLAALSGAPSPAQAAKSKKQQRGKNGNRKRKNGNGGKGNGGKGNGGNSGNGNGGGQGSSLPSVRFVETTTTFTIDGVVSASSKCPNGYLPISAGFFNSVPKPILLTSTPRLAQNDWEIEIDGASSGQQMTVTVVCLAASDDTTAADSQDSSSSRRSQKRSRKR